MDTRRSPRAGWAVLRRVVVLALLWLVVTVAAATWLFFHSSRTIDLASHETVLRPTWSGWAEVHTGPLLPDLRIPSSSHVGVDLELGGTEAQSLDELVQRYAFIASHPQGQIDRVQDVLTQMALVAGARGAVLGLIPVAGWLLIGASARAAVAQAVVRPVVWGSGLAIAAVVTAVLWPWGFLSQRAGEDAHWSGLQDFVGSSLTLPAELSDVQITTNLTSEESRRLVLSAVSTYRESLTFYDSAAARAADLPVRAKQPGETVVLLVSDRHDNIGMDAVARAVGDAGGATVVFSAGDETSTGSSWEAFSLDSLQHAFADYTRYAVSGNHDHGSFVSGYLEDRGWTDPGGKAVPGPAGSLLWGLDDPRSSGLGNWVDLPGSYADLEKKIADEVCAGPQRVGTVLVHAASMAREVLERGCADLVIGGHLHVQEGPTRVLGTNGDVGYTYTNGTTGGAAYAIAVGSSPRREAEVTLLTYRDGRPVGIQPVRLQTNGDFHVEPYVALTY